jgi:MFS family permease
LSNPKKVRDPNDVCRSVLAVSPTHQPLGFRSLPGGAQRYLIATLINMIGNGMLFAFLFIYLTDVRGLSGGAAGWVVGSTWMFTISTSSIGGALVDRFGSKAVLLAGVFASTFASVLYTWTTTVGAALLAAVLAGALQGIVYPSQQAFSAAIVSPEQRPAVSSWLRIALNIGAGLGASIAGLFVSTERPSTYTLMFFLNALTFVGYGLIIATIKPLNRDTSVGAGTGTYRAVLADRFYMRLLPVDLVAGMMFGLAFMVMPTTFLKRLGATERTVGLVVMSGTVAVILSQLAVAKAVRGRARMVVLSIMFGLFGAAFVCGALSVGQSLAVTVAFIVAAQVVGGFGEACLGPTRNPLTADVAPPELLGRYYGLQSMMFSAGFGLSIAGGGAALDVTLRGVWFAGALAAAAAGAWALRLDQHIPHAARLSP